jgi:hypothetical protein
MNGVDLYASARVGPSLKPIDADGTTDRVLIMRSLLAEE